MSEIRPEEIKQAFALFDPQNTGRIEPQEFQKLLNAKFTTLVSRYNKDESKDPEEPYIRVFKSINRDGSGHISAQELRVALESFLGPNVLSEGDVSGDGRITLEEFLKIVHKSEQKHRGEQVI
ncbi:hypothetical protein KI688_001789 [Linnemannia hyalina]|uniref:EF-hand domain-containing protein n=1 Tax=Linnemannia hyalina TaxID=64524 RepID=A0A9P8BS03_9FUNG|nr:hypothetical protein KI688_001789 [Linnemannia hyalina]